MRYAPSCPSSTSSGPNRRRDCSPSDLPGTRKLVTECALEVGQHGMSLRAFVARKPDENHAGVYRWLLERNLKLHGICFAA